MEGLARHMLLLWTLLDDALPLKERVERFLEVHGNTQLREQSGEYVAQRGKLLADVVLACSAGERPAAAGGERSRLLSLFDLSMLRYKERDALVEVFRRSDSLACAVCIGAHALTCRAAMACRCRLR